MADFFEDQIAIGLVVAVASIGVGFVASRFVGSYPLQRTQP